MASIYKFKTKAEFQKELRRFFNLMKNPAYRPRPSSYNEKFSNGDEKALDVIYFLKNNNAPLEDLAYISIGGADGADVIKVLQNTDIPVGILLEYDSVFCQKAREESKYLMHTKQLHVVEGDAFAGRFKVHDILMKLLSAKKIKGAVVTGFSVFHELPYRTPSTDYSLRNLINEMTEGLNQVYFYAKEPCDFAEWRGRLEIAFPKWMSTEDLYKLSHFVQRSLAYNNTAGFNEKIVKVKDGVEMHASLATEVVKKLLYFLLNGSVDNLLYELQESHARFRADEFSKKIHEMFSSGNRKFEFDVKTRLETSNTFKQIYLSSGIKIKSIDSEFLDTLVPTGFTVLSAFYRPISAKNNGEVEVAMPAETSEKAVLQFFSLVEKKKYDEAFRLLNANLRNYRWNNDINRFIDGYSNKKEVRMVAASRLKENILGDGWIVYLQERINTFVFDHSLSWNILRDELGNIDFDALKHTWEILRDQFFTLGAERSKILKSPFFRLLQANSIDDLRWISGVSNEDMNKFFRRQEVTVHAAYLVFCQEEQGSWVITKISPVIYNGVPLK